ncbi:MAG: hypothetical protein ABIH76_07190, partial [Candidatus Bathyarchaeota archaeon]
MGLARKKRGFFFSIDALLAAAILLSGVLLVSSQYVSRSPTIHVNHISQDVLECLSELQVYELESDYVDNLRSQGVISSVDNNRSVLEMIGRFWSSNNLSVANDFAADILEEVVPSNYGFGVFMNVEDMVYQRSNVTPVTVNSAKKVISGVEYNKPVDGFVASASATQVTKSFTETVSFSPQGAGWYGSSSSPGWVYITKYFNISSDYTLTNATFYISVHGDRTSYNVVNINGGTCTVSRMDSCFTSGEGTFCRENIDGCLQNGLNTVVIAIRNYGYNSHIHPGMFIQYSYEVTESPPQYSSFVSKRYYFDNTRSVESSSRDDESGAWQVVPFYIPPTAINVSASVRIVGQSIEDFTSRWSTFPSWNGWRRMRDYDYILFINGDDPFDYDNNPSPTQVYTYSPNQINNELIEGTNTLVVYFNNYGDYRWGEGDTIIYSDPINDPDGSSYIELNYTKTTNIPSYGSIKVANTFEYGGGSSSDKTTSFSFPAGATDMGDVFAHIVQTTSYSLQVSADTSNPPGNVVFTSSSSRDVPTTVYVQEDYLSLSSAATNYVRLRDLG